MVLEGAEASIPEVPEALGLVPGGSDGRPLLLAGGSDERGLVYAVLELADLVELASVALETLLGSRHRSSSAPPTPCEASPGSSRSEKDDKPGFDDEGFWRRYLSMLVAQRFNRVNFMVGLGYNFPWNVTDGYVDFAYPFLVDVPGYGVRVPQLPDEERERNLQMLRFASEEAVARGLDFQIGLWTHAYEWFESADARYAVEGEQHWTSRRVLPGRAPGPARGVPGDRRVYDPDPRRERCPRAGAGTSGRRCSTARWSPAAG